MWNLYCEAARIFLSEEIWTPLTVLATRETLYLLKEDHQWRKSSNGLTVNENKEPSSGSVSILETLPISCVSSVHLWPSDQCRVDIKLYDEVSVPTWCHGICCCFSYCATKPSCPGCHSSSRASTSTERPKSASQLNHHRTEDLFIKKKTKENTNAIFTGKQQ